MLKHFDSKKLNQSVMKSLIRQNSYEFPEKGIVWIEELKKFRGEREKKKKKIMQIR